MRDDLSISFEEVAAAAFPAIPWIEVLPFQQLWIGVMVRRIELIHPDEELGERREILMLSGSDFSAHR